MSKVSNVRIIAGIIALLNEAFRKLVNRWAFSKYATKNIMSGKRKAIIVVPQKVKIYESNLRLLINPRNPIPKKTISGGM